MAGENEKYGHVKELFCLYRVINDEETVLAAQIGWNVSPRLPCPSPLARMQSFADSLTSVSVHAHIYKNTVKR
jgi:hypothetical protein